MAQPQYQGGVNYGERKKASNPSCVDLQDERELKKHSRSRTPVKAISKSMTRTPAAVRQKARNLGISIGHRR